MTKRSILREKTKKVKQKSKGVLFKVIFGRTMITLLLVALQLLFMLAIFIWMFLSRFFLITAIITSAVAIVYIINSNDNPAFKLAWIIPICIFPVFGVGLYLFFTLNPGNRKLQRNFNVRIDESRDLLYTDYSVVKKLKKEKTDIQNIGYYIQKENYYPTYDHTDVKYFGCGEDMFEPFLKDLESAKKFIFLEYFIINYGKVWDRVLEILKQKVSEGVEVRVMYDGTCSLVALPYHYPKKLIEMGIQAKMFSPIKPLLTSDQNNRDHRKIAVIDGRVAYNGGINLADEYMNLKVRFGYWKDTAVRLEGMAVRSFTVMFLQMWYLGEKGKGEYEKYLPDLSDIKPMSRGFVIPYTDDPTNRKDIAHRVYMDILNKAQKYVHICTPYLVLDNEMIVALTFAAQRGVDVKIVLPHIPDKKAVFSIARSYYPQLIDAGVEIYEFTPGFLHAKQFVSDDKKAVVGSINLDFRSLYEHFECATYLYGVDAVEDIEKDFQNMLKRCMKIDYQFYIDLPILYRAYGRVCRLFGPLV